MFQLMTFIKQIIFFGLFISVIGIFSSSPVYQHLPPGTAVVKVSFSHAGEHKEECIRLSTEEIAALPPQERKPFDCSRERLPVYIELVIDEKTLLSKILEPTGLSRDGASTIYEKINLKSGEHKITARLRDSKREHGFDYEKTGIINLHQGQNYVIDFREEFGGFIFDQSAIHL